MERIYKIICKVVCLPCALLYGMYLGALYWLDEWREIFDD